MLISEKRVIQIWKMYKESIMENSQETNTIDYKSIKKNALIHPTAIVHENAVIGVNTIISPFCVIGKNVVIGNNCEIKSHVVIEGNTTIGDNNKIFSFAVIGQEPQDLKYNGEESSIKIGNNNRIREHCTIHSGTKGDKMITKIGNNNLLMVNTHVAHDCIIGNNCILANNVTLGGHVHIGNYAVIGGMSAVHQKVHIGKHSMIGGMSAVPEDVIPFGVVVEERIASLQGINIVGLKRRNFSKREISNIRNFYKDVFCSDHGNLREIIEDIKEKYSKSRTVSDVIKFLLRDSERHFIVRKNG